MTEKGELELMLAEVRRFGDRTLSPALPPPEHCIMAEERRQLVRVAEQAGFLDSGPDGYGIWGQGHGDSHFTVAALTVLAGFNSGIAWFLHQLAMARFVAAALQWPRTSSLGISYLGHYGLGGESLLTLLMNQPLAQAPSAIADYFQTRDQGRLVVADEYEGFLMAGIDPSPRAKLAWFHHPLATLEVTPLRFSHGLNEVPFHRLWIRAPGSRVAADGGLLARLLYFDGLATVAVTLGTLQRVTGATNRFSRMRRQGGKVIARHSAVMRLLNELNAARQAGQYFLDGGICARAPLDGFLECCRWRSHWMPMASRALNAAMQIHGGSGYMQDLGIEKAVRDGNLLRVMHGSPMELGLLSERAEQIRAGGDD